MTAGHGGPTTVLLVEDDEDDYLITRDMLECQPGVRFSLDWCSDWHHGLTQIRAERHDVYLIDYRLGDQTGLDLVRQAFVGRPSAPVIILTGQDDHEIDLEATALGVTDFLLKQELTPRSLERSIRYALRHQTALEELAQSEERYELAARAVNDGIWDWDLRTDRIHYSPRWHAVLGRSGTDDEENDPRLWFDVVHQDDRVALLTAIEAHIGGRTPHLEAESRMRHTDGSWRRMLVRGLAIRGASGQATRIAGSLSDVTDRRRAEDQLQRDAFYDDLTGLPNRALFINRLEQALRHVERDPSARYSVLFLDIDRFKLVNDSFSHAVGDRLLMAAAARIAEVVRPGDTVARIGGDEFTVLLEDVRPDDPDTTAARVAERVQEALRSPFRIDDRQLVVTASIGICVNSPGTSAVELLRNADIAMYVAKRKGGGACAIFDASMHRRFTDRMSRENDLRRAVEESLLEVYYQPVVDLRSGRLSGFEALARWPRGWTPATPAEFIPIAEEIGLISSLGEMVLSTALSSLSKWRRAGLVTDAVRMSVNVSRRQLDDPNFLDHVHTSIAAAGLPGEALRLEITDGTLMREPERLARIVDELCASGVGLELDDFGTGYSSLSALLQFRVEALKIDRSFVVSLAEDTDAETIVRSTVTLAHGLGLSVIAEGIEEPSQLAQLLSLGCEYGQGFLLAEPQSEVQTVTLLEGYLRADAVDRAGSVGSDQPAKNPLK